MRRCWRAEVLGISVDDLHRIIANPNYEDIDFEINATPDVISLLESYGLELLLH